MTASAAGCTLSQEDEPEIEDPVRSVTPVDVRVARVVGNLSKADRAVIEESVTSPVAAYLNAAFPAGPYPSDFGKAFEPFTEDLAKEAREDRRLLTNAGLPGSVASVHIEKKVARLTVLAPEGEVAGVTAHVRLVLVADEGGSRLSRVTMWGRLLLARGKARGWEIFGYDLARSTVPVKGPER